MTLPAKLSFMAKQKLTINNESTSTIEITNSSRCLHGIKQYGEKRLAAAITSATNNLSTSLVVHHDEIAEDTTDKSEEEFSKALIIDTTITNGQEDSCSSIEACNELSLRCHALRLNPSYYSSSSFTTATTTTTSIQNFGNIQHVHHSNTKKQSLNFHDDIKASPRKSATTEPLHPQESMSTNISALREKRKSPIKKIRSPNISTKSRATTMQQPMVVIHQEYRSGPMAYAKKLKSLIDSSDEHTDSEKQIDKIHESIIAHVKEHFPAAAVNIDRCSQINTLDSSGESSNFLGKYENYDDMEFLPEDTPPRKKGFYKKIGFPKMQFNLFSSKQECTRSSHDKRQSSTKFNIDSDETQLTSYTTDNDVSSNHDNSDEDSKWDIVATMATDTTRQRMTSTSTSSITATVPLPISNNAFTRDEDKVILIEMKLGSINRNDLFQRINAKLPSRTFDEISIRHQFLMDFLSKLQRKN